MEALKVNMWWKVVLNTTDYEYGEFFDELKELISKEVHFHLLSSKEMDKIGEISFKEQDIEVYAMLVEKSLHISCIVKRNDKWLL